MLIDVRRAATWPLRSVGLDPGRALANARPGVAERDAQRRELRTYIQARFPAKRPADTEPDIASRANPGEALSPASLAPPADARTAT
jgi:hypothetical protein